MTGPGPWSPTRSAEVTTPASGSKTRCICPTAREHQATPNWSGPLWRYRQASPQTDAASQRGHESATVTTDLTDATTEGERSTGRSASDGAETSVHGGVTAEHPVEESLVRDALACDRRLGLHSGRVSDRVAGPSRRAL